MQFTTYTLLVPVEKEPLLILNDKFINMMKKSEVSILLPVVCLVIVVLLGAISGAISSRG
jgi:hypothetical protein